MHEYSLVESLVRRVEAEARRRGAVKVHALVVGVGERAGVDPELFRTAYETFRAGTGCAEAELRLVERPARWACPSCASEIGRGAPLRCEPCGAPARLLPGGDDLVLESIDLEVP